MSGSHHRVLVVGSVNVDQVIVVPRLPKPGETVGGGSYSIHPGGKGANQAVAAARLGVPTMLVAAVGRDDHARLAMQSLHDAGVDAAAVVHVDAPTGVAQILVDHGGENLIAIAPGANQLLYPPDVAIRVAARVGPGDVVVSNLEVSTEVVAAAFEAARRVGARTVLNPAPAVRLDAAILAACDVIVPNEHESALLASGGTAALLTEAGGAVVETLGPRGARMLRAGQPEVLQPAFPAHVVDTTGAGDAFVGGLAATLARGAGLVEAVRAAAAVGALAVEALGAQTSFPDAQEVRSRLDDGEDGTSGGAGVWGASR